MLRHEHQLFLERLRDSNDPIASEVGEWALQYAAQVQELEDELADVKRQLDKHIERANDAEYRLDVAIWELGCREFE